MRQRMTPGELEETTVSGRRKKLKEASAAVRKFESWSLADLEESGSESSETEELDPDWRKKAGMPRRTK